jgi:hypothetical protein
MKTGIFPFETFLDEYDVWEYHPMDQGGRLVQLQLVDSERDVDMVVALQRPGFFAPWGEPIQWDRLESTEVEKSVWLNRWYYLPSFARLYRVTGDRGYLDNLLGLLRRWTSGNPVPTDLPAYFRSHKYIWRDMQVAWRVQNLIWCYFLGQHGFTAMERQEMLDSIETHAAVLTAYFGDQALSFGNHQSHGALAMLHAAVLLPELPNADAMQVGALKILEHHLEAAFFTDGNSVELCPGYYPFIVANFRDACLLCTANGIPLSPRWKERLGQFHAFMSGVQQPDGTTPPINDSTEVPVRAQLRILGDMLGLPTEEQPSTASVRFSDSHQAVMRDSRGPSTSYLFLDAAAGMESAFHWHAGKLGFHYWHAGRPCLVDSGICNYDEPLRKAWYLTAEAHNTILVDGLGDRELATRHSPKHAEASSCLGDWQSTREYDLATMTSRAFLAATPPVSWMRQILMLKQRFVIVVDRLECAAAHDYRWLFHYTPTALRADASRKRLLTGFDDRNLMLMPFQPERFQRLDVVQRHINQRGRNMLAPVGDYAARAADMVAAFLLLPVSGTEFPNIDLQQTSDTRCVSLDIHIDGESIHVVIPDLRAIGGAANVKASGTTFAVSVEKRAGPET